METAGVGESAAAYLRATHLLLQAAAADQVKDRPVISNWSALLNYVRMTLRHETAEQVRALFLDRKNKLIADEVTGAARWTTRRSIRARSRARAGVGGLLRHPRSQSSIRRSDTVERQMST